MTRRDAFLVSLAAISWAVAGGSAIGEPAVAGGPAASQGPRVATVPFVLDHNRLMVEVEFVRPDGTTRRAQAWLDTGNQHLGLGEKLARDLGFDLTPLERAKPREVAELEGPAPRVRLGGLELDMTGIKAGVHTGVAIRPGVTAELNLPASALRRDHVVVDYPARRLTVARPGVLEPRGTPIPCRVNADTGLLMVATTIDGESVELGVDTGSAGTWVSTALTRRWQARHPDWPSAVGAVGSTNFWGIPLETGGVLMRLPEVALGPLPVRDVALLGLDQRLFDWYSTKSAGPVAGFLGANVLKRFRLEVDYPNRMTYWEGGAQSGPNDLDIVGLAVRQDADGSYAVAGIVTKDGAPAVEGVKAGDALLRVGSLATAGAPMGAVVDALRGAPGEVRTLVLARAGREITVRATVRRLP